MLLILIVVLLVLRTPGYYGYGRRRRHRMAQSVVSACMT